MSTVEDGPPCPRCGFDIWWNGKCFYCDPPKIKGFTVDVICAGCGTKIGEKSGLSTARPIPGMCDSCSQAISALPKKVPAVH